MAGRAGSVRLSERAAEATTAIRAVEPPNLDQVVRAMALRRAQRLDIPKIAGLHKLQFGDHFLGGYSEILLQKYYLAFLGRFIFFVSIEGENVNGFVLGGGCRDIATTRRSFLSKNFFRMSLETLRHPRVYGQALSRVQPFLHGFEPPSAAAREAGVELLSVAVSEDVKGSGLARDLVAAFEENLNNAPRYKLKVKKDNYRAIGFYKKMGFTVASELGDYIVFIKELESKDLSSQKNDSPLVSQAGLAYDELFELRRRYERRKDLPEERYHPLQPYNVAVDREKSLDLVRCIEWARLFPVANKKVLEIGCGSGKNLLRLILLGFQPENLVGNDLLEDSVLDARHLLPSATKVMLGDASDLDLEDQTFDVVYQSLVFTSILDDAFQQKLANRMWGLAKHGGGILWYDFIYDNPKNPDVRGVPVKRIRQLFPEGEMKVWRLTLAPPLGRLVTRISPRLYSVFNAVPFLRTHVLCWIRKT